jgi:hypothetical protein
MEDLFESLAYVVDQVESVGHLLGLRKSDTTSRGIGPGSISGQDFHLRMNLKPLGERLGAESLKEINGRWRSKSTSKVP